MITTLSRPEVVAVWRGLRARLLSGLRATAGDPIRPEVPVSLFERSEDRGLALLACLERAQGAAGGGALFAIDYDPVADGVVGPSDGFRLERVGLGEWLRAGDDHGWTFNGTSFAFTDDTLSWVVLTLADVRVVACAAELIRPLFGDRDHAEDLYWAFRATYDTPTTVPAFRAMTRYARLPED